MRRSLKLSTAVLSLLLLIPAGVLAKGKHNHSDELDVHKRQVVVSKMSVDDGSGTLTIEGLNFGNPDKVGLVTVNLVTAEIVTWSDTEIVITKPTAIDGSCLVTVSRPKHHQRHRLTKRDFGTAWLTDATGGGGGGVSHEDFDELSETVTDHEDRIVTLEDAGPGGGVTQADLDNAVGALNAQLAIQQSRILALEAFVAGSGGFHGLICIPGGGPRWWQDTPLA